MNTRKKRLERKDEITVFEKKIYLQGLPSILLAILLVVVIEHIFVECGDDDSDDDSDDGSDIGWPFTMPHKLFAGG